MTREEALRAMDLPSDATDAAVKRRFKDLAFGVGGPGMHPDKGGSAEAFAVLTNCYRIARGQPVTATQAKKFIRRDTISDVCEIAAEIADALDKPRAAVILRGIVTNLSQKG